ncbi:MAG: hypothetical protein M5U34_21690 [Chloroflexi bacterium]|nr:hypothetical protein [Chloroflexota bacterium]
MVDAKEIIAAMSEIRPTVMVSVPRLYEKIYAAAMHGLNQGSDLKKKLFHWSIGVGKNTNMRSRMRAKRERFCLCNRRWRINWY